MQIKVNRRKFFRSLVGETLNLVETISGKPHLSLSEISELPDEKILELMPMMGDWVEILVDNNGVKAKHNSSQETLELFQRDSIEADIFNHFNGQHSIEQIAQDLATTRSLDIDKSFQLVRNFFIRLVQMGFCVPSNMIE
jgi:hypothetical protein